MRGLVMVTPVTTRIRRIPTEVGLGAEDGLDRPCVINLDTIATIPKSVLTARVAVLRPGKVAAVDRAVRFALGLA